MDLESVLIVAQQSIAGQLKIVDESVLKGGGTSGIAGKQGSGEAHCKSLDLSCSLGGVIAVF